MRYQPYNVTKNTVTENQTKGIGKDEHTLGPGSLSRVEGERKGRCTNCGGWGRPRWQAPPLRTPNNPMRPRGGEGDEAS